MRRLDRNWLYGLILLTVLIVFEVRNGTFFSSDQEASPIDFSGQTMGTTYHVIYYDAAGRNLQRGVDSVLVAFNEALSNYIPNSELSRFNRTTLHKFESSYFPEVLRLSREVYQQTNGAYDPTVAPIVNAWGFGTEDSRTPDQQTIDSLLQYVAFDSIYFDSVSVCKLKKGVQLNFNAAAKGYGGDVVAQYLASEGIKNLFVEIGGEVVCRGTKPGDIYWAIGIETPVEGRAGGSATAILSLTDKGVATSGNYRNYYVKDGVKYAHTISPKTGKPVTHSLLSATVVAADCGIADAYATAFMVMGIDKAKAIVEATEGLEAFFIYSNEQGAMETIATPGLQDKVQAL